MVTGEVRACEQQADDRLGVDEPTLHDEYLDIGESHLLGHHVLLFGARRAGSAGVDEVERDIEMRVLVAEPGRVEELGDREEAGGRDPRRVRDAEAARHETLATGRSEKGNLGARPSARNLLASTNAAKSGCGRSGRLLNSGCDWVATKNGCCSPASS